jgi:LysM repeat protein
MTPPEQDDRARSYASAPRRRRRYSVWTLLAPAAVVILWISFFSALGKSCVFKECADAKDTGAQTTSEGDDRNDVPRGGKAKVKSGDSLGSIATRFKLTEEELKACNPLVDPQALQPDTFLLVSAVDCEDADKAETGANPDPLAGDTTAGADDANAPDPTKNGTAAADPTVQDAATAPTDTTETAADQGDEG